MPRLMGRSAIDLPVRVHYIASLDPCLFISIFSLLPKAGANAAAMAAVSSGALSGPSAARANVGHDGAGSREVRNDSFH